jgi:hypothetical protein
VTKVPINVEEAALNPLTVTVVPVAVFAITFRFAVGGDVTVAESKYKSSPLETPFNPVAP